MEKIIVILGPTASGKTQLSLSLAYKFHGEILCADSRTVYREMNIGTAKVPGDIEKTGEYAGAVFYHDVAHWLLDLVNPDESFTVMDWKNAALKTIDSVVSRHRLPFVVGGTGLYIQSLIDNLEPPKIAPDPNLRASLELKTLEELLEMLRQHDPEAVGTIDVKNPRRVMRALEIAILSREPIAAQRKKGPQLVEALQLGITQPREELYRRIDARVDEQVKDGLFEEVAVLYEKYGDVPALSAIGYREIVEFFKKNCTKEEAIERIKLDTHAYARRQMTWFRRDKRICWVKDVSEAEKLVREFLRKE